MNSWRWVALDVLLAVHDRQLAEHGGSDGVRDENAIASALTRPQNLAAHAKPDAAALAAAYASGIARNHGFVDGNKRTAWVVARVFLADNGYRLRCEALDAIRTVEALAAGTVEEAELAEWFRSRLESPK